MSKSLITDQLINKMRLEIQQQEDENIFKALDAMAHECWNQEHHPGVQKIPRLNCPHEECWVSEIMES